jgi:hypothetical protein
MFCPTVGKWNYFGEPKATQDSDLVEFIINGNGHMVYCRCFDSDLVLQNLQDYSLRPSSLSPAALLSAKVVWRATNESQMLLILEGLVVIVMNLTTS